MRNDVGCKDVTKVSKSAEVILRARRDYFPCVHLLDRKITYSNYILFILCVVLKIMIMGEKILG